MGNNEDLQQTSQETIVMIKPTKEEIEVKTEEKKKKKFRINFVGAVGVIVLLVILYFIYNIAQSFMERSGTPVVGQRFNHALDPKIEKEAIANLKEKLKLEGIQVLEVNLTSATLRITADVNDEYTLEQVKSKVEEIKNILATELPFEQYFTNKESVKMYDFEIYGYNILQTVDGKTPFHYMIGKTGSGSEYQEVISSPKNEKVAEEVTKKPE